jgi:DNA integrity scanning protein DisA with diadenylate cyclase activity
MKPTTQKFFAELKKAKSKTNLSKSKKYAFNKVAEVNDGFSDMLQDLYSANESIDRLNSALSDLDTANVSAMGKFVDIADTLRELQTATEEIGIDFRELLEDDVNMFLDQFGEIADNNNTTVNNLLNSASNLEKI